MGFWGAVGKFAGKTALGIIAPGALAGYEYQKAKQTNEMLKGFDEAIEPLFKNLSSIQDEDSWSELLVMVRSLVVKFLSDEKARSSLLKDAHPNEQARTCCTISSVFCEDPAVKNAATQRGANIDVLRGTLNVLEELCQELDRRIAKAGLEQMEENVMRMFFDILCTRNPHLLIVMYVKRDKNSAVTVDALLDSMIFPDEVDSDTQALLSICAENKVSYDSIKRKMKVKV